MGEIDPTYYTEHAASIGRVTIAWNECQETVFHIFFLLSGMTWENAQAVFFALKSDATQREITIALLPASLATTNDEALRKKLTCLLNTLGRLSGQRNAATHQMWLVDAEKRSIHPHPSMPKRKLLNQDFKAQFEVLACNLSGLYLRLNAFADALRVHLELRTQRPDV
jgi:hypothetical protein